MTGAALAEQMTAQVHERYEHYVKLERRVQRVIAQFDQLEEEYEEDQDYYINRPTLEMFAERGADPELIAFLKQALGDREDMEIVWSRG